MRWFIILFLSFFPLKIFAANFLSVVINEIAWMGSTNSANEEWIELYNNTENPINLDGWKIIAQDGKPKINLSGIIPAKGFYLLKRTNDPKGPDFLDEHVYQGSLENKGEDLKLYDNMNNIIDEVNCSSGWFFGNNQTKQTMERKFTDKQGSNRQNWQESLNPNGTPKTKNSVSQEIKKQEIQEKEDVFSNKIIENRTKSFLFIFFIALTIAIFSGIIILIIKLKLL